MSASDTRSLGQLAAACRGLAPDFTLTSVRRPREEIALTAQWSVHGRHYVLPLVGTGDSAKRAALVAALAMLERVVRDAGRAA